MRSPSSVEGCVGRESLACLDSSGATKQSCWDSLTIQNPPAALPGIRQPWNQKSVERPVPGLAQRRATRSVFHYKGRGWFDNPRQRSPLVQSPPYLCATPEKGHEKPSL